MYNNIYMCRYAVVERFVVYYATDMTAVIDEVIIVEGI